MSVSEPDVSGLYSASNLMLLPTGALKLTRAGNVGECSRVCVHTGERLHVRSRWSK